MTKKYDISKSSDMKRFTADIEKEVKKQARSAVDKIPIEIKCPHCKATIKTHAGKSICPFCKKEINLKLDKNF